MGKETVVTRRCTETKAHFRPNAFYCLAPKSGVASEHETGRVDFCVGLNPGLLWLWPNECRDQGRSRQQCCCRRKAGDRTSSRYRESRLLDPDQTNARRKVSALSFQRG